MRRSAPSCHRSAAAPWPGSAAWPQRPAARFALLLITLLGLAVVVAATVAAQPTTEGLAAAPDAGITTDQVETKIAEVEASTQLDESVKTKLLEHLRRTLTNLEMGRAHEAKAAAFAEDLQTAPAETAAIRAELAAPAETEPPAPERMSLAGIEQRLNQIQAEAALLEAKAHEIERALEGRAQRPEQARQRIAEARGRLEEIDAELKLPAPEGETPALTEARRWALQTAQQSLWSEIRMLEQELASAEVRHQRLKARGEAAAAQLKQLRTRQQALQEELNERRYAEAKRTAAETEAAEAKAAKAHPLVQALTHDNADLGRALEALTAELDKLGDGAARIQTQAQRMEEEFQGARQRIEIAGITHAFGQFLLERRQQLPGAPSIRRQLAQRQDTLTDSLLRQLLYQEERRRLTDLATFVAQRLADATDTARHPLLREQLREAAERRVELLDQALALEEAYQRRLNDVNFAATKLLGTIERYDEFLAERLLWVRSAEAMGPSAIAALPGATAWLLNPTGWSEVVQALFRALQRSPVFWLGLATFALLLWYARRTRAALRATAEPLRRVRSDSFLHTLKGLALTALDASPWPLLLALLGWQLTASQHSTVFTDSVGRAMLGLSLGLYCLRGFRVLCISGGVADRHFRWPSEALARVRLHFDWFITLLLPVGFVAIAIYNQDNSEYLASLGRLALILLLIGFAVFFARLLHPSKGALTPYFADHPDSLVKRSRHLWYLAILSIPLILAVLALVGFAYTAGTLFGAMVNQLWLALGLIVLHQSIVRWLIVTRRQLTLRAALGRQAARRAEAARQAEDDTSSTPTPYQEPQADLSLLDEQSRKLINTVIALLAAIGLWWVWRDLLPALGVFDRLALWHYTTVIEGADKVAPFTVADFGILILIGFLAFAAARHLPALIEIVLLKQTSVSSGSRYAIKTLVGYAIFAAAVLLVFSSLGLSWSQAQWLVAALGVGIGFGLQEIVANFISGLIILFERPVRVGDIVTIGDTTGYVTRIRIRATTIRNWDRQELLVPNKEFITGRLLNWTLTDQTNRFTVTVGVAYGSDTGKALQLLSEVARAHDEVLDDPEPLITFEGFGDNALLLVLRGYLASLDNRLTVISQIHQAINERFSAADITIAFPQRDVHLSCEKPLDIRLLGTDQGPRDTPAGGD